MIPHEIVFNKRITTGDYQHEDYTIKAALEEGDSISESLTVLKAAVLKAFGANVEEVMEETNTSESSDEEDQNEGEENEESNDQEDIGEEEEIDEEESLEEVEEEEKPKKVAKSKAEKTPKKKKDQPYDRGNKAHKDIFVETLKAVCPDWKKSEKTKAKALEASKAMEGKDFLDFTGAVIPGFRAELKKMMTGKK